MSHAIERVTLTHLQIPLKEPLRSSSGELTVKDAILVAVESSIGVGLGECSPLAERSPASAGALDRCWQELSERIVPGLLGRRFSSAEEIAELFENCKACRAAITGAETACWDLLGQARHEPLAELLGASPEQVERGVESGLTIGLCPTVVELIRTIDAHLVEGYRRVKIKIAPGRDIAFVRAVRQHFGDIPLMVDANGAYQASDLNVFRELDTFDLLMIEQPMAPDDLEGLAALQKVLVTPICLDETADLLERTSEAITREAGRIVNIKLQRVGGLGPALALHNHCYAHGVACWVGTTPELGVGLAQALHLSALPNCKYPTDVGPSTRWFVDDYVVPSIEMIAPGILPVPTRPGLGFQLDPTKVRRYQVRHHEVSVKTIA